MSKTLTNALATARTLADGAMHFAIASIVAFGGVRLALPVATAALRTAGIG